MELQWPFVRVGGFYSSPYLHTYTSCRSLGPEELHGVAALKQHTANN